MPTATPKDVKKSAIPKRILNRIDAAFGDSLEMQGGTNHPDDIGKARKKVERDRKEVLAYIEDLIAKSAG